MIRIELDEAEVKALAEWIASGGQRGAAPGWYVALQIARTLNCPVFEIEDTFCELDDTATKASREEWLARAILVQKAEVIAGVIIANLDRLAVGR
jgi:hypothetical protein